MVPSLTRLLRWALARQWAPFRFKRATDPLPPLEEGPIGLYLHIPFCKTLCPFCPYYRVAYDPDQARSFKEALIQEIHLIAPKERVPVCSLYLGGGSPALLLSYLPEILAALEERFILAGPKGIELHPRDVTSMSLGAIQEMGFTMVSLGAQSFNEEALKGLGRDAEDELKALELIVEAGFEVIDVDLMFGLSGQTIEQLVKDFRLAFYHGATQISTYPFIDFSYAQNREKPLGRKEKKVLLKALVEEAQALGLERTSVWTFGRPGAASYSSVTRDRFLGLGPGAASLRGGSFHINTFSLGQYITSLAHGASPGALVYTFTPRVRALYDLFWSIYRLQIPEELLHLFKRELLIPRLLGWWREEGPRGLVTEKGAYLFHLVEQHYTHRYLDTTWRLAREEAWPEEIVLD